MRPLALAAFCLLAGCAVLPPSATGTSAHTVYSPREREPRTPERVTATDLARLIHAEANRARERNGRRPYGTRDDLSRVALAQSRDMITRDFFDHVNPDGLDPNARARQGGVRCSQPEGRDYVRLGVMENLFQTWVALRVRTVRQGSSVRRTAEARSPETIAREVIDGWLDSPGHRRALLDRNAQDHGLGVAIRPDGAIYVTEVIC